MFPVGEVVLLPGVTLPIFVFEPRYRELLGRVRASGEPFGIPCVLPAAAGSLDGDARLARVGDARLGDARLARVGSLAHLTEVAYNPDGTALVRVVGGERYRIRAIDRQGHPYAVAEAVLEPVMPSEPAAVAAVARRVVPRFLAAVRERLGDVAAEVPPDPLLAASFVAANLGLPGPIAQRVLEAPSLLERYEVLSDILGVGERALN